MSPLSTFFVRGFWGGGGDWILVGDEGRHKACPYGGV